MTAYENNVRTKRMGSFIRMRADHKGWLIQFPGLDMRTRYEGRWKIYVQMRTGGSPEMPGQSFQAGRCSPMRRPYRRYTVRLPHLAAVRCRLGQR